MESNSFSWTNSTSIISFCVILGKSLSASVSPGKPPIPVVSIKPHSWQITPLKVLVLEPPLSLCQGQGPEPQRGHIGSKGSARPLRHTMPVTQAPPAQHNCVASVNVGSLGTIRATWKQRPKSGWGNLGRHHGLRGPTCLVLSFCFLCCVSYQGLALCQVWYCFTCSLLFNPHNNPMRKELILSAVYG